MRFISLKAVNLRCFSEVDYRPARGNNLIYGANGSGKNIASGRVVYRKHRKIFPLRPVNGFGVGRRKGPFYYSGSGGEGRIRYFDNSRQKSKRQKRASRSMARQLAQLRYWRATSQCWLLIRERQTF
jgi:hypothetical protein